MLRDLSIAFSPILVLLLVVLTPVGTGQGAHRDQLLDPLFPHVHIGSGLTSTQTAALQTYRRLVAHPPVGPALGAGAGTAITAFGPGVTPPVPGGTLGMPVRELLWRLTPIEVLVHGAPVPPPPDPPPTNA
jgi:hypothetical protein